MTRTQLEKVYYLKKELEMWEREYSRLNSFQMVRSPLLSDMPKGGNKKALDEYAAEVSDCLKKIEELKLAAFKSEKEIIEFIGGIDDTYIRQIIYLRCIKCMSWNKMALILGYAPSDTVRMAYRRFLLREGIK